MVAGILDNAEAGCSAEEIAGEIFPSVTIEQVRAILRHAYQSEVVSIIGPAEPPFPPVTPETDARLRTLTRRLLALRRVPNRETIEAMQAAERGEVTTVGQPRLPDDPWLRAMLDDVYARLGAMIKARGDGEFSPDDEARYWALVRELTEIDHAIHEIGV
jgi:hypothetical protein